MRGLFRTSLSQQWDKSQLVFLPTTAKLSGEGLFGVLEAELTSFESERRTQCLFKALLLPDPSFIQVLSWGCQTRACLNPTAKSSSGKIWKKPIYFKGSAPSQSVGEPGRSQWEHRDAEGEVMGLGCGRFWRLQVSNVSFALLWFLSWWHIGLPPFWAQWPT